MYFVNVYLYLYIRTHDVCVHYAYACKFTSVICESCIICLDTWAVRRRLRLQLSAGAHDSSDGLPSSVLVGLPSHASHCAAGGRRTATLRSTAFHRHHGKSLHSGLICGRWSRFT